MNRICNAGLRIVLILATIAWFPVSPSASGEPKPIPPDIAAIFKHSAYASATWGLQVMDLGSARVIVAFNSDRRFYIGSVRKAYSPPSP